MKFGEKVTGNYIYIPRAVLGESVPGAIYEVQIRVKGSIKDEVGLYRTLKKELSSKFNAKVLYYESNKNMIKIQIEGSPFTWATLLAFLPQILTTFGVIVLGIAVLLLAADWGRAGLIALLVGGALLGGGFATGRIWYEAGVKREIKEEVKKKLGEVIKK